MKLSLIDRDLLVGDSTMSTAGRLVAAAIFELAQEGYIVIHPQAGPTGVTLERTDKSADPLQATQRDVLVALFLGPNEFGQKLPLAKAHDWPVAPLVVARARARLVKQGLIRKLKARVLKRILIKCGWIVIGTALLAAGIITRSVEAVMYTLLAVTFVVYVPLAVAVSFLEFKRVLLTSRGYIVSWSARRHYRQFITKNRRWSRSVTSFDLLPQELLWAGSMVMPLPSTKGLRSVPSWWQGAWSGAGNLDAALKRAYVFLYHALTLPEQKLDMLRQHGPDSVDFEIDLRLFDPKTWGLQDDESVSDYANELDYDPEVAQDFSDWNGSGGDGGGDGDGGDSGGDG